MKGEDELAPDSTGDENVRENVELEEEIYLVHERRLSKWREEMDILFNELKIPATSVEDVRKRAHEKAQKREVGEKRLKKAKAIIEDEKSSVERTRIRGTKTSRRLFPNMYDASGYLKPEFNSALKGVETNLSKDRFREAFLDGWKIREDEEKSALERKEELLNSRDNAMEEEVAIFLMEIETIQRIRHGAKEGLDRVTIQLPDDRLPNSVVVRSSTSYGKRGHFHRGEKTYEGEFVTHSGFNFRFNDFYYRICGYLAERGIDANIEIEVSRYPANFDEEIWYVKTERKSYSPNYQEWKASPISGHIILGLCPEF